ncbi:hypothetical protein N9368_03915 [Alphaproteobacteria bacterium]|nr:hypothetical protein [Alphaproteobacteria bacterium]
MTSKTIKLTSPHFNDIEIGAGKDLVLIAGPCAIETRDHSMRMAEMIGQVCDKLGVRWIFKACYDKDCRSSPASFHGLGLLLNNYEDLPTYFLPWETQFKSWAKWLQTHQMSPLEGAFSCVNSYFARGINKIIFGANSSEQLKDLISKSSTPAKSPSSAYRSDDLNLIHPYNWVLK